MKSACVLMGSCDVEGVVAGSGGIPRLCAAGPWLRNANAPASVPRVPSCLLGGECSVFVVCVGGPCEAADDGERRERRRVRRASLRVFSARSAAWSFCVSCSLRRRSCSDSGDGTEVSDEGIVRFWIMS